MGIEDYSQYYADSGKRWGVPATLLMAQGQAESSGDPNAFNEDSEASGIAQMIPSTAKSLGLANPKDPQQAIDAQAKLMAENMKRYGDPKTAVLAYHGGTNKQHWGPKTQAYAGKVMNQYNQNEDDALLSEYELPVKAQASGVVPAPNTTTAPSDDETLLSEYELPTKKVDFQTSSSETSSANQESKNTPFLAKVAKEIASDPMGYTPFGLAKKAGNAMLETAEGGLGNLGALGNDIYQGVTTGNFSNPPTPEMIELKNKIQEGSATRQDKEKAFLSEVSNSPGGHFAGAAAGLIPAFNIGSTAINKLVNPAIQEFTGISPEDLQTGELIGGTALGAKYVPIKGSGQAVLPLRAAGNLISEITGKNAERLPDEIIHGHALSPLNPESFPETSTIPGVKHTLGQATGDAGIAQLERTLENKGFSNAKQEDLNNTARQNYFTKLAGTAEDIVAKKAERKSITDPLYDKVKLQSLNPEAIEPVLSKIDSAIEEVGEGSEAGKTLITLRAKIKGALPSSKETVTGLLDANGKPITKNIPKNTTQSPLIQIFREERDNLQKPATQQGAYAGSVKSTIRPIVQELGSALESQSEPFAKAQQVYREKSPEITAGNWLQTLRLTDANGRITLGSVNNVYENIQKLLKTAPADHPVHSLSPEQLSGLKNLRDDLRISSNSGKGKVIGSNSLQNAEASYKLDSLLPGKGMLVNKISPEGVGAASGGFLGNAFFGPAGGAAGGFLGGMAGRGVRNISDARGKAALNRLHEKVSDVEAYKNYLKDKAGY